MMVDGSGIDDYNQVNEFSCFFFPPSIYLCYAWISGPKTRQGKAKSAPPPSLLGGALSTPSEAQDAPPQSPGPDEKKADGVENAKTTPAPRKEVIYRNLI